MKQEPSAPPATSSSPIATTTPPPTRAFSGPKLERFNWALDWFDQIAAGDRRNQTALWVAYEDGRQDKLTFAELSERSNRFANYYRGLGVRRGDRVLLMLGNIPPLWETMLAMMKLGAVDHPATTLLTANDDLLIASPADA